MSGDEKKQKRTYLVAFMVQRPLNIEHGAMSMNAWFTDADMKKTAAERFEMVRKTTSNVLGVKVDDLAVTNIVNLDQVMV